MTTRSSAFIPGDVYFRLATGRIVARSACTRKEPPKDAVKWCVEGQTGRGWMDMSEYGKATKSTN
jgi:hypothetical protein